LTLGIHPDFVSSFEVLVERFPTVVRMASLELVEIVGDVPIKLLTRQTHIDGTPTMSIAEVVDVNDVACVSHMILKPLVNVILPTFQTERRSVFGVDETDHIGVIVSE
jgi:hypothetical protein